MSEATSREIIPRPNLSREIGVAASYIEKWHQRALKGIMLSLKDRERSF